MNFEITKELREIKDDQFYFIHSVKIRQDWHWLPCMPEKQ